MYLIFYLTLLFLESNLKFRFSEECNSRKVHVWIRFNLNVNSISLLLGFHTFLVDIFHRSFILGRNFIQVVS